MMSITFILGTVLSLGHHFYYGHLDGQIAPSTSYRIGSLINLTDQQVNLAVGAIFVFLVKSSFDAAVSIAHEQTAWRALKQEAERSTKISVVDGLLNSRSYLLSVFQPKLWKKSVLSMALALLSWYVETISILPLL